MRPAELISATGVVKLDRREIRSGWVGLELVTGAGADFRARFLAVSLFHRFSNWPTLVPRD